jgi:hypothetical protein
VPGLKKGCDKNVIVLRSNRFKSSTNGSTPGRCNWLRSIVKSKIFITRQIIPLFSETRGREFELPQARHLSHFDSRPKGGDLQNVDDPHAGPRGFDIDCFGQGEAARISFEAQTNPLALLNYLDKFVDLNDEVTTEESAREQLLVLQTEIEKAEQNVQLIPQYERLLATTRQQLAALQKPEVKELIELQRHLATEREVRTQIVAKLQEAKADTGRKSPKTSIEEIRKLTEPTRLSVGAAEFRAETEQGVTNTEVDSRDYQEQQANHNHQQIEHLAS